MHMPFRRLEVSQVGLVAVLVMALIVYLPGLGGSFMFDDFNSLSPLANWPGVNYLERLRLYVFSGFTGPGGRPLALLTFFFNSSTWPADPSVFILTNILLHLFNGFLVYIFIKKLRASAGSVDAMSRRLSLIVAALWVLHPFHASTVLYVVQRMTILSAGFSLAAFIAYLYGREALYSYGFKKALPAALLMTACGILAFMSKENAVLIPVQILLIELLIRAQRPAEQRYRVFLFTCLIIPSCLILLYLAKFTLVHVLDFLRTGQEATYGRTFTLSERLYTQQRVLGDYLLDLVIPRMHSSGVFHDGYEVSRSLFDPFSTFIWAFVHISLIGIAVFVRNMRPWISFGILWFYASHLIESTVVMLELKFEHRNYLPSLGLSIIGAYAINKVNPSRLRNVSIGFIIVLYTTMLYMSSSLWGDPLRAAMVWAQDNPKSARAYDHATLIAMQSNVDDATVKFLAQKSVILSKKSAPELKYIAAFCETYNGNPPDWRRLSEQIRTEDRDWSLYLVLKQLLRTAINDNCGLLTLEGYRMLLNAYRENPAYHGNLSVDLMDELEINAALHFGNADIAFEVERQRDELILPLAFKMSRAGIFASYGYNEFAAQQLAIGIAVAEKLNNESAFNLANAREMLELIKMKEINVDE